jgi:hypothetical protein
VGLDHADNHIGARFLPCLRALQHFIGLADAGSGADKDLQPAGAAALPPGGFQQRIRRRPLFRVAVCHKSL